MISDVSIQGFRCFSELILDKLAPINVFFGQNNSGKTCFLEALETAVRPEPTALMNGIARRLNYQTGQVPTWNDLEGLIFGHRLHSSTAFTVSAFGSQSFAFGAEVQSLEQGPVGSPLLYLKCTNSQASWSLQADDQNRLILKDLQKRVSTPAKSCDFIQLGEPSVENMSRDWDVLLRREGEQEVLRLLQVLEPRLRKIQFSGEAYQGKLGGVLLFLDDESAPLSLASQGDGFKKLLRLATCWASHPGGIVFIDEIESGLHYRSLRQVWKMLFAASRDLGIQFFISTHSLDCLEALAHISEGSDTTMIAGYRLRAGQVQAVRYSGPELMSAIENEIEVR